MKKLFSVLLAVILVCGTLPAVISSAAVDARLYNVYADGMIFQQNSEAIFAGTASSGARISVVLKDAGGNVSASGEASAGADGTFTVSFDSPAGSFDAYTVELSANGIPFCTLSNIVFGEVWLSAGQSNMSYAYVAAEDYVSPGNAVTEEKSWIRLFWCPEMAQYNGSA